MKIDDDSALTPVRKFDHLSWQDLPDNLIGNKRFFKGLPSLKFLLKWTNDDHLKSKALLSNDMGSQTIADWCEQLSSAASTSSLSTSGISSDIGSDDADVASLTAIRRKVDSSFTLISTLSDYHEDAVISHMPTIELINFVKHVIYCFKYNNNMSQQTETCDDFICPWCYLNCIKIEPLLMHLRLCHDRFKFRHQFKEEGVLIEVTMNERYNCSLSTINSLRLLSSKHPKRRSNYTKVIVPRRKKQFNYAKSFEKLEELIDSGAYFSFHIFSLNLHSCKRCFHIFVFHSILYKDTDIDDDEEVKYNRAYRSFVTIDGHNRKYSRTTNNMPYTHQIDFDEDSEGEHDNDWQRKFTQRQLDEFMDVNEGEKEMFVLWNLYVMKNNFIGDCKIPEACSAFVDIHGAEILQKNLYRNFMLHLCNLSDNELLTNGEFLAIVNKINAKRLQPNDD